MRHRPLGNLSLGAEEQLHGAPKLGPAHGHGTMGMTKSWKMSEEMEGDGWRFSSTELMKPEDDIGSDPHFRCLGDINIK